MIVGFFQFQQFITQWNMLVAEMGDELPPLDFNFGIIFLFLLVGTLIMTPTLFFIGSGTQYLGVRLFGGSGDFKSHLYLLAVIQVPVTVLGGVIYILTLIPFVELIAILAGLALLIFTLIINVRVIKAVHDLNTGRAIAGMILPPLILGAILGCLLMVFGSALVGMLASMA
jgi:hypothetical protein